MTEPSLDDARRDVGLSTTDLWLRYFALGGNSTPIELEAYLHGALEPTPHERNLIAHAMNEHDVENGGNHPVHYAGDIL